MFNQKPLDYFYPVLCKDAQITSELENRYGENTKQIVAKILSGENLQQKEMSALDIIEEVIANEGTEVDTLWGYSSAYAEEFPISIMKYGSVFWIQEMELMEHDDIGYFDNAGDARKCAVFNYESAISLLPIMREEEIQSKKAVCRLSLTWGSLSDSSWIEARSSENGFTVVSWDENVVTIPTTIANIEETYNWKLFAKFLMQLEEGFVPDDALQAIEVVGESGIIADCLRIAWSYGFAENTVLDWLLQQEESSLNFIDSNFRILENEDDYQILSELYDLILYCGIDTELLSLLDSYDLPKDRKSIEDLLTRLENRKIEIDEQSRKSRSQAIEPFRSRVESIANLFSDETPRSYASRISGAKSKRTIVRTWIENYIAEHGHMPDGKHDVYIHGSSGIRFRAGEIDFSNIPDDHTGST